MMGDSIPPDTLWGWSDVLMSILLESFTVNSDQGDLVVESDFCSKHSDAVYWNEETESVV